MTAQIIPFPKTPRSMPIKHRFTSTPVLVERHSLPAAGVWQAKHVYHKPTAAKGRCVGRTPCGGLRLVLATGYTVDVSAGDCWWYPETDGTFDW